MIAIIWLHVKACLADLRVHRLGDLYYEREETRDVLHNEHREWRLQ